MMRPSPLCSEPLGPPAICPYGPAGHWNSKTRYFLSVSESTHLFRFRQPLLGSSVRVSLTRCFWTPFGLPVSDFGSPDHLPV
ncbi:hypothetical protein COCON_G00191170 [Conger conger]|uniref:Uncharacterized protein n=1 Tax=Conger conger TaxID=82655 RepID=A0A9Q1D3N1_CONCO|nr:hypothetical protein COCON_G00191170 [Conger conger]